MKTDRPLCAREHGAINWQHSSLPVNPIGVRTVEMISSQTYSDPGKWSMGTDRDKISDGQL